MRVQNIYNNNRKPMTLRQNVPQSSASIRPSFKMLKFNEKSFKQVFPKFAQDEFTFNELKGALMQFEDRASDDVELGALE